MTKEEYINEYRAVLRIKRLAQTTIEVYISCLKMFLNWCEEADIFPPNLTKSQLVDYLSHTESASLLRQQIGTIGNFYQFVLGIPYITAGIPYPRKRRSVQIIINRAMAECNILKDGSTHLLRHSRATHLLQNGSSLRHVQMILRHKKSTTTEIYTHLNRMDLRLSVLKCDNNILSGLNETTSRSLLAP